MGEAKNRRDMFDANKPTDCICAFQETNRNCPVHGAERRRELEGEGRIWVPPAARPLNESELKPPPLPEPDEVDKRVLELEAARPNVKHHVVGNHWQDPEPDPMAFRCPHCGAWRPAYGFSGQRAELPGYGTAELMGIFCGVCKVMLQVQLINLLPPGTRGRTH